MSRKTVFLSYRRDEHGKPLAHLLKAKLTERGYDVFVDVVDTRAGCWPEQLANEVRARDHFLIVLTPGSLGRCSDENDWVRREFEIAVESGRNIVPILAESLDLEAERKNCPAPMRLVFDYQATTATYDRINRDIEELVVRYIPMYTPRSGSRPADQPPHNLPSSIGGLFMGRDAAIEQLRDKLRSSDAAAVGISPRQLVHGLGGVGKTRLAIEYAWRHLDDYSALLFVRADDGARLEANLAGLCRTLDLPEQDVTEQAAQVAAVRRWLDAQSGWLLILDNVDDEAAAQAVQPLAESLTGGDVLITGRWNQFGPQIATLELDVLDEDSAVAFLLESVAGASSPSRLGPDAPTAAGSHSHEAARQLARRLDRLAVALEQATGYIRRHRCSFEDYTARWETAFEATAGWHDPLQMKYPRAVLAAWLTTEEKLSPEASHLLQATSWLATDPIPAIVFKGAEFPLRRKSPLSCLANWSWRLLTGRELFKAVTVLDAANELTDCSMLRWDRRSETFQMHRVVQAVTRSQIPDSGIQTSIQTALYALSLAAPGNPEDVREWPIWSSLSPHVSSIVDHADNYQVAEPTGRLMNDLGMFYRAKSVLPEAEKLLCRVLKLNESVRGNADPVVSTCLGNLALLLMDTDRNEEAEALLRRALKIDEQVYGIHHPAVALDLNNLAQVLRATNQLTEAEALMRRTFEIDQRNFGSDDHRVARDLSNLAQLLMETNRLPQAESMMQDALEIERDAFGDNHPNVARRLNDLAMLFRETGRVAEAETLQRQAIEINENAYGPEHPVVAANQANLALLLMDTNRSDEAESMMRSALAINECCYGESHSKVAQDLNNLATLLQETGRLSEAEPLLRRALEINERTFGNEHPAAAAGISNLAMLAKKTLRFSDAEELMRRALQIDEQCFGVDHPNVAIRLNNLSSVLQDMNRQSEAEPLIRRALRIAEKSLGKQHPDVAISLNNLATLLHSVNRDVDAESTMRRAVEILIAFGRVNGVVHTYTQATVQNYSALLRDMDMSDSDINDRLREIHAL